MIYLNCTIVKCGGSGWKTVYYYHCSTGIQPEDDTSESRTPH